MVHLILFTRPSKIPQGKILFAILFGSLLEHARLAKFWKMHYALSLPDVFFTPCYKWPTEAKCVTFTCFSFSISLLAILKEFNNNPFFLLCEFFPFLTLVCAFQWHWLSFKSKQTRGHKSQLTTVSMLMFVYFQEKCLKEFLLWAQEFCHNNDNERCASLESWLKSLTF